MPRICESDRLLENELQELIGSKWDLIAAGDAQQPFMVREHDSKMVSGFSQSVHWSNARCLMGTYRITRFNCWTINVITRNCFVESQHSLILVPLLYKQCHSGFSWVSHATSTRCKFICSRMMEGLGSWPNTCCNCPGMGTWVQIHSTHVKNKARRHTPVILAPGRTRQEDPWSSLVNWACWIGVFAVPYSEHIFSAPPFFPHAWFP